MADTTTKTKILDIQTGKAEKNVKSLKTQIRELKEQMAGLEKNTVEYDAVAKKLADTMQKQTEINEAAKYSNKDLGATLSNLTTVATGVVGAISSVNGVMSLMGADSEEAQKAMVRIQSLMSIIQGMGAIDTAIKALKGLTVAFKDFNVVRGANAGVVAGAATAELGEAGALADNTVKMRKNNEEAKEFNRLNVEGEKATKKSKDAIDEETTAIIARTEAQSGNIEAANEYLMKLKELEATKAAQVDVGKDLTKDNLISYYQHMIKIDKETLQINQHLAESNPQFAENLKKEIAEYEKTIQGLKDGTIDAVQYIDNAWALASSDFSQYFGTNKAEEIKKQMEGIAAAMSPEQIENELKDLNEELTDITNDYLEKLGNGEQVVKEFYQEDKKNIEEQIAILEKAKEAKINQTYQEEFYKKKIFETIEAENVETASLNTNTTAKEANSKATEDVTKQEGKMGAAAKKSDPLLRKAFSGIVNGVKNAAKALKSFVAANPILATIAASAAVVAGAFALIARQMRKSMEEMRAIVEFNNEVNHSYEEQQIRLNVLLNTARDETQTLIERKKATDELNKLIPSYNAELDETTGKYKENTNALNNYLDKLREKIELEAYEGRIKDLLQQRLELEQKLIKVQTSGWNIFGIRVRNIKNDIKDIDKEIDKLYGKINDLYLPWALDDNKPVTNGAKTVLKTFKDIIDTIKSMYADIWNAIFNEKELRITYNGVYRETDILFNNIERLIKSRNIQGLLSDEFKKAMSENFTEDMSFNITLDWVFDRAQQEKFYNELEKERISLEKMLSDKTKKYTDDEIKFQQDKVNGLKAEEESRKLVLEAVQKYFVQRRKEADETERLANAQENYNHQLEVEKKYINEQRRGDRDAEANKEIALGEYQIETIKQRIQYRKSEIDMLKSLQLQNEQVLSRIKELNAEQLEDQKKTDEELAKVDNAYYQKRLNHLEKENSLITANSEEEQRSEEIRRMLIGGGVVDYNTDVDLIGMQLKAIEQQKEKVNSYYETEKSKYAEDTEEWLRLEQERLEALDRLQEEYSKKDIERQMADADRKLAIQKAYIAAYQSISSQVSNILGEVMNSYDESSKEYLNLRYAQGVTDTLSGTLSAYMSGIESGIPAPGNQILAAAMAASTFAVGVMQLANIKSGTLSNATPSTVQIGNEYDTLSYMQGAEILSNIQDQRIYVTEHDITTTQRRVQVQESNATF